MIKRILTAFFLIIISSTFICYANDFKENKQEIEDKESFVKSHLSCNNCDRPCAHASLDCGHLFCDNCIKDSKVNTCFYCQKTTSAFMSLKKKISQDSASQEKENNEPLIKACQQLRIINTGAKRDEYGTQKEREEAGPVKSVLNETNTSRGKTANGFFYNPREDAEPKDVWRCYFCGIGLNNWQFTDDPAVEHGIHAQHCGFNFSLVGNNFSDVARILNCCKQIEYLKEQNLDSIIHILDKDTTPDKALIKHQETFNKYVMKSITKAELKKEIDELESKKKKVVADFNNFILWIQQKNEHDKSIEYGQTQIVKSASALWVKELLPALLAYKSTCEGNKNPITIKRKEAWELQKSVHKQSDDVYYDICHWSSALKSVNLKVDKFIDFVPMEKQTPSVTLEEVINTMLACDLNIEEELQDQIMEHFLINAEYYKNKEGFSKLVETITAECTRYDTWNDGQMSKSSPATVAGNAISTFFSKLDPLVIEYMIQKTPDCAKRKALKTMVQLNSSEFDTYNTVNEVIKLLISLGYTFDECQENHIRALAKKLYSEKECSLNELTINCLEESKIKKFNGSLTEIKPDTDKQMIAEYSDAFSKFKEQIKCMQCDGCHKNLKSYLSVPCFHQLCHECRFSCKKCPACEKDLNVIKIKFESKNNNEIKDNDS